MTNADIVARGVLPVLLLSGRPAGAAPRACERDNHIAKFWLGPVAFQSSGGLRPYELRHVERIIQEH